MAKGKRTAGYDLKWRDCRMKNTGKTAVIFLLTAMCLPACVARAEETDTLWGK